jgi:hypothetical protein
VVCRKPQVFAILTEPDRDAAYHKDPLLFQQILVVCGKLQVFAILTEHDRDAAYHEDPLLFQQILVVCGKLQVFANTDRALQKGSLS